MGRNVRDELYQKNFNMPYMDAIFAKMNVSYSRLNKWSLASIFLLTNHKPKQTPEIFLEHVL